MKKTWRKPATNGRHKGRIGVAKGYGPLHAENALEGRSTDTVPALLTPHEAVLNRNAAELAGRGAIEKLNRKGNLLAQRGVDLAAGGDSDVRRGEREDLLKEAEDAFYGGGQGSRPSPTPTPTPVPKRKGEGTSNMKPKKYQQGTGNTDPYAQGPPQPGYPQQAPGPAPQPYPPPASFFPTNPPQQQQPVQAQSGAPDVQPIGAPQGGYPWQMVPLTGGQMSALQKEMEKQGLNKDQIAGLSQAFKGFGQAGSAIGGQAAPGAGAYQAAGSPTMVYGASGYPSAIPVGGYQGGISDIGYPPFVAPNAVYHADKGSTWVGPFDQNYMIPRY